jgi:hypothetical protein
MIGTSSATSGTVRGPVVLQRVDVQRAAALACQHGTAQPQARTRHRYPVADLKPSQFAPAQPGQRQDRHDIAVRAPDRR